MKTNCVFKKLCLHEKLQDGVLTIVSSSSCAERYSDIYMKFLFSFTNTWNTFFKGSESFQHVVHSVKNHAHSCFPYGQRRADMMLTLTFNPPCVLCFHTQLCHILGYSIKCGGRHLCEANVKKMAYVQMYNNDFCGSTVESIATNPAEWGRSVLQVLGGCIFRVGQIRLL